MDAGTAAPRRPQALDWLRAGAVFALGAAVMVEASGLRMGTPTRIGPGVFPFGLGAALCVVAVLMLLAERGGGDDPPRPNLRALAAVPLAMLAMGLALQPLGLVVAIPTAVLVASAADPGSRLVPTVLLAAFMTAFGIVVFVTLLGLNLPVGWW